MAEDVINRSLTVQVETLDEAAELAGIDAATLAAAVEAFNAYVTVEKDLEFGRTKFNGTIYITKLQMLYTRLLVIL